MSAHHRNLASGDVTKGYVFSCAAEMETAPHVIVV
jgi:hypothetical protein